MNYHIDTGLIKDKFSEKCDCPLCEIKKIVEEQFLHEFLNDAVMEDNTRIKVGKKGFCARHFDMLFNRHNKLSVALQIRTRLDKTENLFSKISGGAEKLAKEIENSLKGCVVCDLVNESMVKYYKTVAELYAREKEFTKTLLNSNGFCLTHYAELLKYSKYAGFMKKSYLEIISGVQKRSIEKLQTDLKAFCDKHDYRNASVPLGDAENALPSTRTKLYGKKYE